MANCPHCDESLPAAGDAFCPYCGRRLDEPVHGAASEGMLESNETPAAGITVTATRLFFGEISRLFRSRESVLREFYVESLKELGAEVQADASLEEIKDTYVQQVVDTSLRKFYTQSLKALGTDVHPGASLEEIRETYIQVVDANLRESQAELAIEMLETPPSSAIMTQEAQATHARAVEAISESVRGTVNLQARQVLIVGRCLSVWLVFWMTVLPTLSSFGILYIVRGGSQTPLQRVGLFLFAWLLMFPVCSLAGLMMQSWLGRPIAALVNRWLRKTVPADQKA